MEPSRDDGFTFDKLKNFKLLWTIITLAPFAPPARGIPEASERGAWARLPNSGGPESSPELSLTSAYMQFGEPSGKEESSLPAPGYKPYM